MSGNGYNPLLWNCQEKGCFNIKKRAKIEVFAEDLPNRIGLSDIDACVEINHCFLFLEFKPVGMTTIPTGQKLMFQRLTALSERITVIVICGNAETMEIASMCFIERGSISDWERTDLSSLKGTISRWVDRAIFAPSIRPVAA